MPVYILHFEPQYKHARHYIGWAMDEAHLNERIQAHIEGRSGQPLVMAAVAAGCKITAHCWLDYDKQDERVMKKQHGPRNCPCCNHPRKNRKRTGAAQRHIPTGERT